MHYTILYHTMKCYTITGEALRKPAEDGQNENTEIPLCEAFVFLCRQTEKQFSKLS